MVLFYTFFSSDFIGKIIIISLMTCSIYSIAIIVRYGYFFYFHDQLGSNLKLYLSKMKKFARINAERSMYLDVYDKILDIYIVYGEKSEEYIQNNQNEIEKMVSQIYDKWEGQFIRDIDNISILGSISPFVGLLGTVLGIMNSFQAIARSNSNSIAIVAPALSEALCVTALGIFVAIPANIGASYFYSKLDYLKKDIVLFKSFILETFQIKGDRL